MAAERKHNSFRSQHLRGFARGDDALGLVGILEKREIDFPTSTTSFAEYTNCVQQRSTISHLFRLWFGNAERGRVRSGPSFRRDSQKRSDAMQPAVAAA
jgi:hypothetical protein